MERNAVEYKYQSIDAPEVRLAQGPVDCDLAVFVPGELYAEGQDPVRYSHFHTRQLRNCASVVILALYTSPINFHKISTGKVFQIPCLNVTTAREAE